jgi:branched-chain amino acid transport system substrate-binding protein
MIMRLGTHRRTAAGALLAGAALLATACSAPGGSGSTGGGGSSSGPVKMAIVDAQSGQLSSLGHWEHNGVTLAVDEINAKGGVCGGRKIELTQFDDQGDPTTGTTLAQKVATGGYTGVFGTAESGVTLAMIPVLGPAAIPMITSGQSPKLEKTGSPFIFLNSPTSTTFDSTLAKYLVQRKGLKNIAMISNNGAYGSGEHDAFTAALKDLGVTPLADEVVTPDQKDFSGSLSTIRGKNPQVLFIGSEEVEAGLIDGSIVSTPYLSNDASDKTRAFAAAYQQKFNETAEAHGAKAYDGAHIYAQALDADKCASGKPFADAVRNVKYDGLQGHFSFNENGVGLSETQIGVIQGGKVVPASS